MVKADSVKHLGLTLLCRSLFSYSHSSVFKFNPYVRCQMYETA